LAARERSPTIVCDVGAIVDPDAATIDVLARLQLHVRRSGCQVRLLNACEELHELLELMGLYDALPVCAELSLEPSRQVEEREQALGVEEEAGSTDPTI
jgi:anti-anti-sigma regulatory factor